MGTSSKRRGGDAPPPARSKPHRKEKPSRAEPGREARDKIKRSAPIVDENVAKNGSAAVARNKVHKQNPDSHGQKDLDTSLLARGMTARSVGIRVANHLKVVSPSEIERDIRHMEAYGAACVSYSQQLFAFSNRELVARGHYGPAPPAPGMTFTQPGAGAQNGYAQPSVTMPVRIDPEEEKRLAILRKRVAASEAKREVLETEYLSLRAHYVHESHKLRRTRSGVTGELKFLRDLLKCRGESLALRRVKCAVAREIVASLEYRAQSPGSSDKDTNGDPQDKGSEPAPMAMDGVEVTDGETTKMVEIKGDAVPADLIDAWALIESKLQEAELSCTDIQTPEELLYIKNALCADATALEAANDAAVAEKNRRSRSPLRLKDGEEEEVVEKGGGKKKKSRGERAARRETENVSMPLGKNPEMDRDDNVVPWGCRVMPRTPRGVALYLSNLSSSAELAAAFGEYDHRHILVYYCRLVFHTGTYILILFLFIACDTLFGSAPESLSWLESNLPPSSVPGAQNDSEKLRKLKEEVELLQAELRKEVNTNSSLQKDAVEGRKKSDEVCAMMTMIRSETEAVVHRHNQILEVKEMIDEDNRADLEAGQVEDDDDDDTEVAEDDDGHDVFGTDNVNDYGGDFDASNSQPVKEVIVPSQTDLSANSANIKRGFSEDDALDKKRRKLG